MINKVKRNLKCLRRGGILEHGPYGVSYNPDLGITDAGKECHEMFYGFESFQHLRHVVKNAKVFSEKKNEVIQ